MYFKQNADWLLPCESMYLVLLIQNNTTFEACWSEKNNKLQVQLYSQHSVIKNFKKLLCSHFDKIEMHFSWVKFWYINDKVLGLGLVVVLTLKFGQ